MIDAIEARRQSVNTVVRLFKYEIEPVINQRIGYGLTSAVIIMTKALNSAREEITAKLLELQYTVEFNNESPENEYMIIRW